MTEFPRGPTDPIAYDFVYTDQGPHHDEIDEWFVYQFWQWVRLNAAQRAFDLGWQHDAQQSEHSWDEVAEEIREHYIRGALEGFKSPRSAVRKSHMGKIVYLVLGRWGETAGGPPIGGDGNKNSQTAATAQQLQAIKDGVLLLAKSGGIEVTWEVLRKAFEPFW